MLSIVLYGRNDNYGYNLHKRAALSLNCMAEVLSDVDDEILFVDYNTPDDFPTFPEAIADTLTEKAKKYLKVLRARPNVHARFAERTHLVALEPVARNIAVRRSNPANRWILSTNTDMIFVPRHNKSLSEIVRDLPKKHYGIPRFEVPETLWEGLDRRDPAGVINTIGRWGSELHLNEIVAGMKPFLFDAPGDFQLIERSDLFAIQGFNEEMLLGWHVDANIAKRLSLIHGNIGDLTDQLFGYHCDHTRQVTPMHKANALENNYDRFFFTVTEPDLPDQAETWGSPDDTVEEVRIIDLQESAYISSLAALMSSPLAEPLRSAYVTESYNRSGYTPEHVLPFLLDIFASAPRSWQPAWLGSPGTMFRLFVDGWRKLGFTAPILMPKGQKGRLNTADEAHVEFGSFDDLAVRAHVFIFDFSRGDGSALQSAGNAADQILIRSLVSSFQTLVAAEEISIRAGKVPRRFVGINAIHNQFEGMFSKHVSCAKTPFSVRIRHGLLFKVDTPLAQAPRGHDNPDAQRGHDALSIDVPVPVISALAAHVDPAEEGNWLSKMQPGEAGSRRNGSLTSMIGVPGLVATLPPIRMEAGRYQLDIALERTSRALVHEPSGFSLWLIEITARARTYLGYARERRLRRRVSHILGPNLSGRLKSYLKMHLTHNVVGINSPTGIPIILITLSIGGQPLMRRRLLGGDVALPVHRFEFEIAPAMVSANNGFSISISSNGVPGFALARLEVRRSRTIDAAAS